MSVLQICRICLESNVRMHRISGSNVQDVYEKLTNKKVQNAGSPHYACYMCYCQLQKCNQIVTKAQRAEELLLEIFAYGIETNKQSVSMNRQACGLLNTMAFGKIQAFKVTENDDENTCQKDKNFEVATTNKFDENTSEPLVYYEADVDNSLDPLHDLNEYTNQKDLANQKYFHCISKSKDCDLANGPKEYDHITNSSKDDDHCITNHKDYSSDASSVEDKPLKKLPKQQSVKEKPKVKNKRKGYSLNVIKQPKQTKISPSIRRDIVNLHQRGYGVGEICRLLPITRSTAYLWINRWKDMGNVNRKKNYGRPKKTNANQDETIVSAFKTNPTKGTIDLAAENKVSISTIRRRLKQAGLICQARPQKSRCPSIDINIGN